MKVLIAGANSYIGTKLISVLLQKGHEVICLLRDKTHFSGSANYQYISFISGDLLRSRSIENFPVDIDAAFYLAGRLTQTSGFAGLEALSAQNFMERLDGTNCSRLITLRDIPSVPDASRQHVEQILGSGKAVLTILQSSMIIGRRSIAIELFEALTQKAPVVIARNWSKVRVQPIYVEDVLNYLACCLENGQTAGQRFDIGGPQVLTFKQMLLTYIAIYKSEKPSIMSLPMMNPKLTSYLVNFLLPVSYPETQSLIENLQHDNICHDDRIKSLISLQQKNFRQALKLVHDTSDKTVLV